MSPLSKDMSALSQGEAFGASSQSNGGPGGTKRQLPAHLTPYDMKRLAGVLSTPEILQVLAKWKVRHPSDLPLSHKVERSYLLDLLIQCDGALNEVLRVVTAKGGKRKTLHGTLSNEHLKVAGYRSGTPAYLTVLREVQSVVDAGPIVHLPPLHPKEVEPSAQRVPPGGRQSAPPSSRALEGGRGGGGFTGTVKPFSAGNEAGKLAQGGGSEAGLSYTHSDSRVEGGGGGEDAEERRRRRRERRERKRREGSDASGGGGGGASQSRSGGGIRVAGKQTSTNRLSKAELNEKLVTLTAELEAARVEREVYTMDLARKGMLAVTMDSQLNFPVMRGECMRVANVSRNLQAVQGYNTQKHNNKMEGLLVDETLKKVKHHVSPSTHSLCL